MYDFDVVFLLIAQPASSRVGDMLALHDYLAGDGSTIWDVGGSGGYDNDIAGDARFKVPWADAEKALASISVEVELGFDLKTAFKEAQRCLNCDVQTVFSDKLCIECDACVDICPMDCISFVTNAEEKELRQRLNAPANNLTQDLYVSGELKTKRVMVKDEDVCLHCSLCAERCPTGAWDMQKFLLEMAVAGPDARAPYHKKAA